MTIETASLPEISTLTLCDTGFRLEGQSSSKTVCGDAKKQRTDMAPTACPRFMISFSSPGTVGSGARASLQRALGMLS